MKQNLYYFAYGVAAIVGIVCGVFNIWKGNDIFILGYFPSIILSIYGFATGLLSFKDEV